MQSLHQNVLLLLMLVVTGVSVYIAIEMRKRLNRADVLIHSIESVTRNVVTKQDVEELVGLVTPPSPTVSVSDDTPIKIVQPRSRKRKGAADDDRCASVRNVPAAARGPPGVD